MEIKEFKPEDPGFCTHKNIKSMIDIFKGTVIEICTDCMERFNERPVTKEEADEIGDNL